MRSHNAKREQPRRFAYRGLDRVIHERARLSILASLLAHPKGLAFGELLDLCDLTDGNLSRHLQLLQTEKLITVAREIGPGRPQTMCRHEENTPRLNITCQSPGSIHTSAAESRAITTVSSSPAMMDGRNSPPAERSIGSASVQ